MKSQTLYGVAAVFCFALALYLIFHGYNHPSVILLVFVPLIVSIAFRLGRRLTRARPARRPA